MFQTLTDFQPEFRPPLDDDFYPASLFNQAFRGAAEKTGVQLVIGLERSPDTLSTYTTKVFPENHPRSQENLFYVERIVKFLLWQRGGYKLYIGGPKEIGEYIREVYSPVGKRQFDYHFMSDRVYERPLSVIVCDPKDVPSAKEVGKSLGRHLDGCRIGFDLGASDRKVSAMIDGEAVYSEEVVWEPGKNSDPGYHFREIMAALKTAASKMPRVDAIGGSSAGIYIDNQPKVASLFRGVSEERFGEIKNLFKRIQRTFDVPLEVINDGDVTALAGSMSLGANAVLGIAMGSSEATGYVDRDGNIKGWLNELAFAPIDYNPKAPVEEWSGDIGVGAMYFSQQCVFRLAPKVGIRIPENLPNADKLRFVQEMLTDGHEGARMIWESMGIYLGYTLAHYADFYDISHVLILGRCTSGPGGDLILVNAKKVLAAEFPELATRINLQLPDEKSRRVGQSIAAASLPAIPTGEHD
jgi:predicted NBD/HSP70 family sugar kinase